MIYRTR